MAIQIYRYVHPGMEWMCKLVCYQDSSVKTNLSNIDYEMNYI